MAVDIDFLRENYFTYDKPVPYQINKNEYLYINPVRLEDSWAFLQSANVLKIDKNALNSVEIIQMSYLQFLAQVLLQEKKMLDSFVNILLLCLDFHYPEFIVMNGKIVLSDKEKQIIINGKQFDDIRKIILYQNILHYDDEYVNPELKKAMEDMDRLKNKTYELPSLERKMAIISSHSGITKAEQMKMSYRSHELLFEEVCGEIEHNAIYPLVTAFGKTKDYEHYIYKKKKGKYDKYITSVEDFSRSMGGKGQVNQTTGNTSSNLQQQFNSFNQ